jgi:MSHA biogenesis protein MshI
MSGLFSKLRFSRKPKGIVGVGFLSDKLALMHVAAHKGKTRLSAVSVLTVTPEERGKALGEWVRENGLSGASTVLTLESGAYGLFQVDKPAVEWSEMRAAVRWKIKSFIDYPPEQAVVDVFQVPPGRRGEATTIYVSAARKSLLRERVSLLEKAGLRISRIDITELALRNLAGLISPEANETVAMLYFQDQRGWLEICRQGEFYLARGLDYGLNQLVSPQSSQGMGVDDSDMMERVTLEVQRTMDYYDSHFGQAPIKRIGILTETVRAEDLAAYTQTNLGVNCVAYTMEDVFQSDQENAFTQGLPGWVMGGALGELFPDKACWLLCES